MPKIEHTDFYSHVLGREIAVQVTGHEGYPLLMFPTSLGSYTQNHDFKLNQSIEWFVTQGKLKLYNIETLDRLTFYHEGLTPWERLKNYDLYMEFLATEYIPYLQRLHRTPRIAVAGVSFGAYHSANLTFRFPNLVSHAFLLSGLYSIRELMEGLNDDLVYFNSPEEFVRNDDQAKYTHLQLVLSTSDQDVCKEPTRRLAACLNEKNITHWYDEKIGMPHDWPLWREVLPRFIGAYF